MKKNSATLKFYTSPEIKNLEIIAKQEYKSLNDMQQILIDSCYSYKQQILNFKRLGLFKHLPQLKVKIIDSNFLTEQQTMELNEYLQNEHLNKGLSIGLYIDRFNYNKPKYDDFPFPFLNYSELLKRQAKQTKLEKYYEKSKVERYELMGTPTNIKKSETKPKL